MPTKCSDKRKKYFIQTHIRRKELGTEYCRECGKKLRVGCQHHYLCNTCWNELNFFKRTTVPFKKNLVMNRYRNNNKEHNYL